MFDLDIRVRRQKAMEVIIDGNELTLILEALKHQAWNAVDLPLPFNGDLAVDCFALHDRLIAEWNVQTADNPTPYEYWQENDAC